MAGPYGPADDGGRQSTGRFLLGSNQVGPPPVIDEAASSGDVAGGTVQSLTAPEGLVSCAPSGRNPGVPSTGSLTPGCQQRALDWSTVAWTVSPDEERRRGLL